MENENYIDTFIDPLVDELSNNDKLQLINALTQSLKPRHQLESLLTHPLMNIYYHRERDNLEKIGANSRGIIYNIWTDYIKAKYGYNCAICQSRKKLTAHHLEGWTDSPEKGIDVRNGVCLCERCHSDFHYKFPKANVRNFIKYLSFTGRFHLQEVQQLQKIQKPNIAITNKMEYHQDVANRLSKMVRRYMRRKL